MNDLAAGDAREFEVLYRRHAGACVSHAWQILFDAGHAEDAVQEAFLDLWRHADRFDGRRSSVRGWLLMLTHRKAVDRVRTEQRRRTVVAPDHESRQDDRPGPGLEAVVSLLSDDARRALLGISDVKRQALVLAYWGGYSQTEIARITNAPLGTVKTRMLTGMRDLKPILAGGGWSPADDRLPLSRGA